MIDLNMYLEIESVFSQTKPNHINQYHLLKSTTSLNMNENQENFNFGKCWVCSDEADDQLVREYLNILQLSFLVYHSVFRHRLNCDAILSFLNKNVLYVLWYPGC